MIEHIAHQGGAGGRVGTDVATEHVLWDGLRSNPTDGIFGLFLCTPATTKREE